MSLILHHIFIYYSHTIICHYENKKTLITHAFFASIFTVFPAEVAQTNEIIITGSSSTPNGPPRAPSAPSLEAYLDLDVITVYFLNDLGNVTIAITDEWGAVVQQTIEPSACGATAVIDISGLESGSYTITFRNEGSFHKCGEFEL